MPEYKSTILMVDDSPTNLLLLAKILSDSGFELRSASNGASALATIQEEPPDLILLDIIMPGMDGFEVCRRLKEDEQTAGIPIIFISALDATADKIKAFSLGGVDYINKPFQAKEVIARIMTHLTLRLMQVQVERKNTELQKALDENKVLRGCLPICASCKKIRNNEGQWEHIESYIRDRTEAEFTHGYCDECAKKLYPGHFNP